MPRRWLVLSAAVAIAGLGSMPARELTFEERVKAQEAIERAYYAHQIGALKPFEEAVPRRVPEEKVRKYLKQTVALEAYWGTAVTAEMLERETDRMIRGTRDTRRLRELFAVLGNDAFLVDECLARSHLVDRLSRNFFAYDERIHGEARREAEELRENLRSGGLDPTREHARRTVLEIVLAAEEAEGSTPADDDRESELGAGIRRLELAPDRFARWRERLPARIGEVESVIEEREAFAIAVLLEERAGVLRVASYSIPKTSWDSWWLASRSGFDESSVRPVALASPAEGATARGNPIRAIDSAWPHGSCPADDAWDNGSMDDVPDPRQEHIAIWTGSVMVLWGGYGGFFDDDSINSGSRYDPATDTWASMSTLNAPSARALHTAVWTGREVIVWGGLVNDSFPAINTGGRYDPQTDTWEATSTTNAPDGRWGHTAVWTGSEMFVWGGVSYQMTNTGGRYDPATDRWKATSLANAPSSRFDHTAVWTGSEMIVWGGVAGFFPTDTGGRYDARTDTWRPTSRTNAPASRERHTAVWTGSSMIVWGGSGAADPTDTGGRYDPIADAWTTTSTSSAPSARHSHRAVWTGDRMIVWGGSAGSSILDTGGRYAPETDTWTPMSRMNAPSGIGTAVWTGSLLIAWGGRGGARYDPATDMWTPTFAGDAPTGRSSHTAVWTGNVMIVWGGKGVVGGGTSNLNTGSRYDPATGTWAPTSTLNSPSARERHTAIWAGQKMVVWGGLGTNRYLDTGGRYDPTDDTWAPTSTLNVPSRRHGHTAVWTGSVMLVWGGVGEFLQELNTGGRYNPATDLWVATSLVNAPARRSAHTAVWTGGEMIVYGGNASGTTRVGDTGGRYDLVTDTWTPTSLLNAPFHRDDTAVWTGTHMIIWGGGGSRYDPETDTWTPVSTAQEPPYRTSHTALWTGGAMVVWGGSTPAYIVNSGGRYDPTTDTWTPTSSANAPIPRWGHTAVWAGHSMLVWGGRNGGQYLSSGGRYAVWVDPDADGHASACDNCPGTWNPEQADTDRDGLGDRCDNCPGAVNRRQDDLDEDGVGDACDNCILDFNPSQSNVDGDHQGDSCDLDDGLLWILPVDRDLLYWQPENGIDAWNVYEGDLDVLRTTGVYTQAPGATPLAERHCGLSFHWVENLDSPPSGKTVFSLVTGVTGGIEGSLGTDSRGVERPNANPCP